jgi:hypothetical protein
LPDPALVADWLRTEIACVPTLLPSHPLGTRLDDAVIKLLWLTIQNIEDKRARERAKEKGAPRNKRTASGRLVEGAVTQNWKPAMGALLIAYPDRLAPYLR